MPTPTPIPFSQWQAQQKTSTTPKANAIPFSEWQAKQTQQKPQSGLSSFFSGAGKVAKGIGDFFSSSEQGLGQDIAGGASAVLPKSMTGVGQTEQENKMSSDADLHYVQTLIKGRNDALSKGQDTSHYDTQLKNFKTSSGQTIDDLYPALKKSGFELAGDIGGTALDILTAGTYGEETDAMKFGELAKKAIPTALEKIDTKVQENAAKKTADKITEMVSPRLTAKEAEKTAATSPKGFLGKISAIASDRTKQIAEAVKGIVDPSKTFTENANKVGEAISTEAEKLKGLIKDSDHPYTFKELSSKLKNIDIPEFIKTGEATVQKRADSIINKFMEIAKSKDGNISSLLDARKEFDAWVQKEYPRIFDEGGNAVNALVKNVRTAANDFISKEVPSVGVKDSLKLQNLLYEAGDTLSEKAARGAPKTAGEIGTNRFGRMVGKHPLLSTAVGGGATALVGEKIVNTIGSFFNPSK